MDYQKNISETFHLDSRDIAQASRAAPRTPVERAVHGIWTSILDRPSIQVDDDFFDVGGTLILAEKVTEQIREVFLIEVLTSQLFESPSIAQQAFYIEELRRARKQPNLSIPRIQRSQYMPLSFSQQRLWFFEQLEPNSALYNTTFSIEISGPLEIDVLLRGINEIVRRHEALRTTIVNIEGQPYQFISSELILTLPQYDLQSLDEQERRSEILRLSSEEAKRPYDLARGPLIRTSLLRIDIEKSILLLSIHHIVSDGWSFGVLLTELEALYQAFRLGQASPLHDLTIQYVDFSDWQNQRLQGEFLESQLSYWREKLSMNPSDLHLPADHSRPPAFTFRGASHSFSLPESLSMALKSLSQQESVTLYMSLMAVFLLLLRGWSGQDDFCVGTPIANRNRVELESLIGLFINMLVIRVDMTGNPAFRELLQRVKATMLEAYAHQDINFEILVEKLHPKRSANTSPFFQAMFILENIPLLPLRLSELETRLTEVDTETSKFDLSLYVFKQPSGILLCKFEYATDLFEPETIRQMSRHFQKLLEEIVARPNQPIMKIGEDLFLKPEKRQVACDSSEKVDIDEEREDFEL